MSGECRTADAADRMGELWPVDGHECRCDGEGRVRFRDGVVIHVPCRLYNEEKGDQR